MFKHIYLVVVMLLFSACSSAPACDDESVLDTVKSLQAEIFYTAFLKGATLGNPQNLPAGVEDLFVKAYTPDSAEISAIRPVGGADENGKIICQAQLSTKMDVAAHERDFKAGLKPIANANPNNILLAMLPMGLAGLKSAETRSISYSAQPDTSGEIIVETAIEN